MQLVITYKETNEQTPGTLISQDKPKDYVVKEGTTLTIVVAKAIEEPVTPEIPLDPDTPELE